jgi:hypothetical protein
MAVMSAWFQVEQIKTARRMAARLCRAPWRAAVLAAGLLAYPSPGIGASPPPLPDHVIEHLAIWPALPAAGRPATITITVKNRGPIGGDARHLDLWLNRTDAANFVRGEVGDWWTPVGRLEAGESRTVAVPPQLIQHSGTNRLCAFVDFENVVSEGCNTNNHAWLDYVVTAGNREIDLNGDGLAEPALFQPDTGVWAWRTGDTTVTFTWGSRSMTPVPADYDGDGQTDLALYQRATGNWYILKSAGGSRTTQFGWGRTIPLPGDYDGDGQADLALFNPDSAYWYIQGSRAGFQVVAFGTSAMVPVPADYDGDGATDLALYDYPSGNWLIRQSSDWRQIIRQFGWDTTIPVPADYDGDGRADIAILNRPTSKWCILFSGGGGEIVEFGWKTMIPVPADYNGDGRADIAMYAAANGVWHIRGQPGLADFGGPGKIPVLLLPMIHAWFALP